jgi:hypothetical protein
MDLRNYYNDKKCILMFLGLFHCRMNEAPTTDDDLSTVEIQKLFYVRYADSILIGIGGSRTAAINFSSRLNGIDAFVSIMFLFY